MAKLDKTVLTLNGWIWYMKESMFFLVFFLNVLFILIVTILFDLKWQFWNWMVDMTVLKLNDWIQLFENCLIPPHIVENQSYYIYYL